MITNEEIEEKYAWIFDLLKKEGSCADLQKLSEEDIIKIEKFEDEVIKRLESAMIQNNNVRKIVAELKERRRKKFIAKMKRIFVEAELNG